MGEETMPDNLPDNPETIRRVLDIFFPYATKRRSELQEAQRRLVHYTSAENAIKIINSNKLWMRNARCMNDYMEINYGLSLLQQFFANKEHEKAFHDALNPCHEGVAQEAVNSINQAWWSIQFNTYISCISEHGDVDNNKVDRDVKEDKYGRLSMWRSFGRQVAGAAIVLRLPPENSAKGLGVILSPVAYFGYNDVEDQFLSVISNIHNNAAFLKSTNRDWLRNIIFEMIMVAAVSLKHEGFSEEREWRIIYIPNPNVPSTIISRETEIINGVPQLVYKLPLEENIESEITGISIPQLLDKVIIGPSAYPITIAEAFFSALTRAKVDEPGTKITISNIPLRT